MSETCRSYLQALTILKGLGEAVPAPDQIAQNLGLRPLQAQPAAASSNFRPDALTLYRVFSTGFVAASDVSFVNRLSIKSASRTTRVQSFRALKRPAWAKLKCCDSATIS